MITVIKRNSIQIWFTASQDEMSFRIDSRHRKPPGPNFPLASNLKKENPQEKVRDERKCLVLHTKNPFPSKKWDGTLDSLADPQASPKEKAVARNLAESGIVVGRSWTLACRAVWQALDRGASAPTTDASRAIHAARVPAATASPAPIG